MKPYCYKLGAVALHEVTCYQRSTDILFCVWCQQLPWTLHQIWASRKLTLVFCGRQVRPTGLPLEDYNLLPPVLNE